MRIENISNLHFSASKYVSYKNMPESLQSSEPVLTQLAKDNSVTLKILKSKDTRFLPHHNCYTVTAKKTNKHNNLIWGSSLFLSPKTEPNDSVLKKLDETAAKAILKAQQKFIELYPTESFNAKAGFLQRIKNFFKKI